MTEKKTFQPFPVQRVIIKAFRGIQLDSVAKFSILSDWKKGKKETVTETSLLHYLHDEGMCNTWKIEVGRPFQQLVLCAGRRAGKSFVGHRLVADAFNELRSTDDFRVGLGLGEEEDLNMAVVGACKEMTDYSMNAIWDNLKGDDSLARVVGRISDPKRRCRIVAMSASGKALHGSKNYFTFLDGTIHGPNPDKVYRLALMSGKGFKGSAESKVVSVFSPPIMQKGADFAYRFWLSAHQDAGNTLCFRIPSWVMNPTISRDVWKQEADRMDEAVFRAEYGAEFVSADGKPWKNTKDLY
jgi:hypothetical protein